MDKEKRAFQSIRGNTLCKAQGRDVQGSAISWVWLDVGL